MTNSDAPTPEGEPAAPPSPTAALPAGPTEGENWGHWLDNLPETPLDDPRMAWLREGPIVILNPRSARLSRFRPKPVEPPAVDGADDEEEAPRAAREDGA